ncbi:MAG: hypothetical protein M1814_000023 [Vezdaea aestivalis]|nr:MAG: hypothetical protein M1814_000023 [Vezdaea aestivalis]
MASVVESLDSDLQHMLRGKAPGVTSAKIRDITTLCEKYVQNESVLIQKIFTHFKKAPGTHKLGVLYVVDSVTRRWLDLAKKAGQAVNSSAADGSYAAGVNRMTELLPALMNDIFQHAPQEQKEKIAKLITIWERGSTFPPQLLSSFHQKISSMQRKRSVLSRLEVLADNCLYFALDSISNTPPGSPPATLKIVPNHQSASAPKSDASSILAALANIARQTTAASTSGIPAQDNSNSVANPQNAFQAMLTPVNHGPFVPNPVNVSSGNLAPLYPGGSLNASNLQQGPTGVPNNFPPANVVGAVSQSNPLGGNAVAGGNDAFQNQIMILQTLAAQGVPQEQWPQILSLLLANQQGSDGGAVGAASNNNAGAGPAWSAQAALPNTNAWNSAPQSYQSRDQIQSPQNRNRSGRSRSRSRSPNNWRSNDQGQSPPRKRRSPNYGDYNVDAMDRRDGGNERRGRRGGRNRGNNSYRDRSPIEARNKSASPPVSGFNRPKWIDNDPSIGQNNIKVLSRTLFVGGVTCGEFELRNIFKRFGTVQTCIVNNDKRHGFVKMVSRTDSLSAKAGMDSFQSQEMSLRTRWGVGFGPRDCSDYQTGISIIPIDRLTDADRKWLLTAEFGGTGGEPVVGGMVVEEPDIEIGMGVSSKAISRRMATDQNGPHGPRSSRDGGGGGGGGARFRRGGNDGERGDFNGPPPGSVNAMPVMMNAANKAQPNQQNQMPPGFGFMMQNGMPMFPPGFQMPQQQQP